MVSQELSEAEGGRGNGGKRFEPPSSSAISMISTNVCASVFAIRPFLHTFQREKARRLKS